MQILNNTSNTNFSGAFRIERPYTKAKAEIPAMFTQGRQIFRDIKQKGDMVVVLRDNYDKKVGQYIQENYPIEIEYYPEINTKSGLDDEKPEELKKLIEDKSTIVKKGLKNILAAISEQKVIKKPKKYRAAKEVEKIANALRLNIENPQIASDKSLTHIRDEQKKRTIEIIATNPATSYVYVKPDSLDSGSIKCIINGKGQIVKTFETPNDICKFNKIFKNLKENNVNILS